MAEIATTEIEQVEQALANIDAIQFGFGPIGFRLSVHSPDEWSVEFTYEKEFVDEFNGMSATVPTEFHGIYSDLAALEAFHREIDELDRENDEDVLEFIDHLKGEHDLSIQIGRGSWLIGRNVRDIERAKRSS